MRTKPTMHKRMLRSALVAAFSAVLAFGVMTGHAGARSDAAQDSSWLVKAAPGDSSWLVKAAPGDSSWVITAPAAQGDSSWVAPTDSSWAVRS
ncbi:hypothetical protein ABB07_17990 [Streptomyces incarnatus]|uniref:5'-nucleotidase n=2 Tax=Streptomyces incarnatus TaxID=665007 RepID=A0ABM5TLH2_9ACTN|nr:hypothetical protein ABB07_17990 [Streptomyces incarnatus]